MIGVAFTAPNTIGAVSMTPLFWMEFVVCSVHTNALRYAKALQSATLLTFLGVTPETRGSVAPGKVFLFTVCRTPNGFNVRNQLRYPHPFLLSREGNCNGSLCGYGFHL